MTTTKWLQEIVADEIGLNASEVAIDKPFETMNFDSLSILSLSHEIETEYSLEVDPTALSEYNTIEKLSIWIDQNK